MAITKNIFDFHLLKEGWLSVPPRDESSPEEAAPDGRILSLRMIEFGSDDKPDIWYKAEVLLVGKNRQNANELFSKYGLPKAILVNCPSQKKQLEKQLGLEIETKR